MTVLYPAFTLGTPSAMWCITPTRFGSGLRRSACIPAIGALGHAHVHPSVGRFHPAVPDVLESEYISVEVVGGGPITDDNADVNDALRNPCLGQELAVVGIVERADTSTNSTVVAIGIIDLEAAIAVLGGVEFLGHPHSFACQVRPVVRRPSFQTRCGRGGPARDLSVRGRLRRTGGHLP